MNSHSACPDAVRVSLAQRQSIPHPSDLLKYPENKLKHIPKMSCNTNLGHNLCLGMRVSTTKTKNTTESIKLPVLTQM